MSVPAGVDYLRKALYPVFILAAFFGVQMFQYREVYLNYLHYIVMWSCYTATFWGLWIWSDFRLIYTDTIYRLVLIANAITSLMATALTLRHKKKFQRVLEGLKIINTTFGVLKIPNECPKLDKLVRKLLGLWCLTVLYFIITDASWMTLVFGKLAGSLAVLVIDSPYLINVLAYIIVCLMLSYTESRFELLNKHIEKMTGQKEKETCWAFDESYGAIGPMNPMTMCKRKQDIWTLMHIHAELRRICRDLNTIFGLQITFEIASYYVYVCSVILYFFEMYYIKSVLLATEVSIHVFVRLLMAVSWACIYIVRLIYFNYICEAACIQERKTEKLMYDFLNRTKDFQLQEEMRQFVLYMISRPLKFYGAGLSHFGYQFIQMVSRLAWILYKVPRTCIFFVPQIDILTVVVIIIQMGNPRTSAMLSVLGTAQNITSTILADNTTQLHA